MQKESITQPYTLLCDMTLMYRSCRKEYKNTRLLPGIDLSLSCDLLKTWSRFLSRQLTASELSAMSNKWSSITVSHLSTRQRQLSMACSNLVYILRQLFVGMSEIIGLTKRSFISISQSFGYQATAPSDNLIGFDNRNWYIGAQDLTSHWLISTWLIFSSICWDFLQNCFPMKHSLDCCFGNVSLKVV
jgi:hypothetical protein